MVRSNQGMKISEIKVAILELPERQKQGLMRWIADMEEKEWDDQIRDDAAGGKLKKLLEEVDADIEAGRLLRGP
ncbi:MAG TPA: hypothetical protein VM425_12500 [Myxococcota bacterium]|nr:hypothetical protein [Myxococcota bacterium]